MPPPNRRRRQLVVSGGYAAYDSSLPAKMTAATPDKMIVAAQLFDDIDIWECLRANFADVAHQHVINWTPPCEVHSTL
jgi:hypothetical protein